MKKIFLLTIIITIVCFSAVAFDFGGVFTNKTGLTGYTTELGLTQNNRLTLFGQQRWTNFSFSIEGFYNFSYETDINQYADVSLLKISFDKTISNGTRFVVDAGRFKEFDFSSYIINDNIDGLRFSSDFGKLSFTAVAGYTGLLNANETNLVATSDKKEVETGDFYNLAADYVLAGLKLNTSALLVNQKIALNLYGLLDPDQFYENRTYAELGLKGSLFGKLNYTFSSCLGLSFGDYYTKNFDKMPLSNLTSFNISYFPRFKNMSISLNGLYSTGDKKANNQFLPISKTSLVPTSEFTFSQSAVALAGLVASIKPTEDMLALVQGQVLFSSADFSYTGFAYNAMYAWNIFNDLQVAVNMGQHLPKDGDANMKLSLTVSTAF